MINNTMQSLYNDLNTAFGPYTGGGFAPFLSFDPATDLITMNASSQFKTNPTLTATGSTFTPPFSIYFNAKLYRFFQSFWTNELENDIYPGPTELDVLSYQFLFGKNGNGNYKLFTDLPDQRYAFTGMNYPTSYTGYAMTQDFPTLYNWNTFLTSHIPITPETLNNIGSPDGDDVKPILTDFEVQTQQGYDVHSYIQYYPQGEYRLISLSGQTPLTTLDFQLFWRDRQNNLFPIYIPPGDNLSTKLMFRRKDYQEGV
jgi:hypothetical protein